MSDPRRTARQNADIIRQMVREIVAEELRGRTGVRADTYSNANITVGPDGRIVYAANGGGATLLALYDREGLSSQSITTATYTIVQYDRLVYDPNGLVTTGASWHFTVPSNGIYCVYACIRYLSSGTSATHDYILTTYINNVDLYLLDNKNGITASVEAFVAGSRHMSLSAGDLLDVRAYQNTGSNRSIPGQSYVTEIAISKMT